LNAYYRLKEQMMKRLLCVTVVLAAAAMLHAAGPFTGTWKLNVAKSDKDSPNEVIFTEKGDQIELVVIGADGTSQRSIAPLQGGVVTFVEGGRGRPAGLTVTRKFVDAMTLEQTNTLDGKVTGTVRFVLSKDGRSITVTGDFASVKFVRVYDKQ
jgi:hypothetical protein